MSNRPNILPYQEFVKREYNTIHAPFQPEMDFYDAIKSGNTRKVTQLCQEPFHKKDGLGTLSQNSLQNLKYHFVITTAMIARTCISGGLGHTQAYDMSDYYIQQADSAKTADSITSLHDEMALAYTSQMKKLRKATIYSRPISKCIDYIYDHLHTRIRMSDLSELTALSSSYISRLFKKETGHSVSGYILSKKLETSASMLLYTDYSIARISAAFDFPNQGYFTKVFKEAYGISPSEYRNSQQ